MLRLMLMMLVTALFLLGACLPGCSSGGGVETAGDKPPAGAGSINNNDPRAKTAPAAEAGPGPGGMMKMKKGKAANQ